MEPTPETLGKQLRALLATQQALRAVVKASVARLEGLQALFGIRSTRLATSVLPVADEETLNRIARALGQEELSYRSYRAYIAERTAELEATCRVGPSDDDVRVANVKKIELERAVRALRDRVAVIETDPDVRAASEKGGVLATALAGFARGPRMSKQFGLPVSQLLEEVEKGRARARLVDEEIRRSVAALASLRLRQTQALKATAALARLPHEALTSARGVLAQVIAEADVATLRKLCVGPSTRGADELNMIAAKARYLAAIVEDLQQTGLELDEVVSSAERWWTAINTGATFVVPPSAFIQSRTDEALGKAGGKSKRFAILGERIEAFLLPADWNASVEERCWWDVIFAGREDGDFISEVRLAHRKRPSFLMSSQDDVDPLGETQVRGASSVDTEDDDTVAYDAGQLAQSAGDESTAFDPFAPGETIQVPPPVRRIGPYTLVRRLGAGGMAEVHLARRESAGASEDVVVKLILPSLATEPSYVSMFEREARIGALLHHENIVRTGDLLEFHGQKLLTMEFVDGLSTHRLCHGIWDLQLPFPWTVAALMVRDAARGLAYAHGLTVDDMVGVVHRDISPDNLVITTSGMTKILDFGIARGIDDDTLTRSGQLKGKIPFIAPEAYEGADVAPGLDIFALGVAFYWYLTKHRPFSGPTDGAVIRAIMTEQPRPPGDLVDGLPPEIDLLVLEMLGKNPDERPRAADIARVLEPFTQGTRPEVAALVKRAMGAGAAPAPTPAPIAFD